MEKDDLKEILKMDFPDAEIDSKKIISECEARNKKYNKKLKRLTYILSSFAVLAVIVLLSIVLLNNRLPSDVAKINDEIANLENIDNDEVKMLKIMNIEEEIQSISADKQAKINMSRLSYETTSTVNNLKNSVEWKDCINNDVDYYLLESIFDSSLISGIDIHKERFGSEMWMCSDEVFYKDLLTILGLPYVDLLENFTTEFAHEFSDYTNYYYFTLYLNDNELVEIGVYNNGYVRVRVKGMIDAHQTYGIQKNYASLIKLDTKKLYDFVESVNLSKYNAELSMISLMVSDYSVGISSSIGPSMKFNLDGASFECSIDFGSFEYYKETKKLVTSSNEMVQWAPSYIERYGTPESTLVDEVKANNKAYMDVIVKVNEKIVGYIVVEMKNVDEVNYVATILESVLFNDDNNNLKEVPLEFVLAKMNEVRGE